MSAGKIEDSKGPGQNSEVDILDAFDQLACLENASYDIGYQQGFKEGQAEGQREGIVIGFNTGFRVGLDVFYAKGFAGTLLLQHVEDNRLSAVHKLSKEILKKVSVFPRTNVETEQDTVALTRDIRSATEKLKALLGEQNSSEESQKYTF